MANILSAAAIKNSKQNASPTNSVWAGVSLGKGGQIPVAATQNPAASLGLKNLAKVDPNIALGATNKNLLSSLGLDLDTILTPKGKRKKSSGLRGQDPEELANLLGE